MNTKKVINILICQYIQTQNWENGIFTVMEPTGKAPNRVQK